MLRNVMKIARRLGVDIRFRLIVRHPEDGSLVAGLWTREDDNERIYVSLPYFCWYRSAILVHELCHAISDRLWGSDNIPAEHWETIAQAATIRYLERIGYRNHRVMRFLVAHMELTCYSSVVNEVSGKVDNVVRELLA